MIKTHKIPNPFVSDFDFWLSVLSVQFVSDFELRISDFAQGLLGVLVR
jgi:hypothetical protein